MALAICLKLSFPDCEALSHEVNGGDSGYSGGNILPLVAETGPGPEGSRLTVNIRRPWGCGVEDGVAEYGRHVLSTPDMSLFWCSLWQKSQSSEQAATSAVTLHMQFPIFPMSVNYCFLDDPAEKKFCTASPVISMTRLPHAAASLM